MHDELVATMRRQCVEMSCGNCNTCVNRKAADAIGEMSKPRWIPVTERLPELHDEEYLDEVTGEMVRYKASDPILIWLAKGGFMDIGMYERSDAVDDFCYQGVPHTVTYWASLPKPPEEGE